VVAVVAGIVAARVASVVVAAMLINFYYLCQGEYWNSGGSIGTSGKFWDSGGMLGLWGGYWDSRGILGLQGDIGTLGGILELPGNIGTPGGILGLIWQHLGHFRTI